MFMKAIPALLAVLSLASACTWVEVQEGAEDVVVGKEGNTRGCAKLSEAKVKVADNLGPINRSAEKVAEELINMAKNEAASAGGDTIVPLSEVEDGSQSFAIYRCN